MNQEKKNQMTRKTINQLLTLIIALIIFNDSDGQNDPVNIKVDSPQNVVEKVNAEKFKQLIESGEGILLEIGRAHV